LLSGANNGNIAIHDLRNYTGNLSFESQIICVIKRNAPFYHKYSIKTLQWYPFDTGSFTSCSADKTVKIWDTNELKPADTFIMADNVAGHHMSTVSPSSALIAVALEHPHVLLLDPRSGSRSHELRGHGKATVAVRWSPSSEYLLATGCLDGRILLWDIRSANGYLTALDQYSISSNKSDLVKAHNGCIKCMNFTDDGLYLVSLGADQLRLWDVVLHKNTLVNFGRVDNFNAQLKMDISYVSSLPFLFVPNSSSISVYDLFSGIEVKSLSAHFHSVTSCVFRSSTCQLYSAGHDQNILLWTPDCEKEFLRDGNKKSSKKRPRLYY
ncbi:DNA excision repair protein ERCC-8, partial [Caerostris extrusa]